MRPFLKPHVLAHQVCGCQVQVSIYVSEIEWTNTNLQYYSISILTIILHQPLNTIFKLWITLEIKILLMQAWRPFPGYRRLFSKALSQMSFSKVIALWSGINLNLDFLLVVTVWLSHWLSWEEAEEKVQLWLEQDVGNEPLRKVRLGEQILEEMWSLVISLSPNPHGKDMGVNASHPSSPLIHRQVSSLLPWKVYFCCFPSSSLPPFLFWTLCSNVWQSLLSDTWQEALLFETALPG